MHAAALDAFLRAALVPRAGAHAAGDTAEAEAVRAAHPSLAIDSLHAAAVLGDEGAIAAHLRQEPAAATAPGGPYDWDPLTHLCFSRYLRVDATADARWARAAEALLHAGASASTGFHEPDHAPFPGFESVLYGATGIARHPALARVLLAHGADPNDDEVAYHAPEGHDNAALAVLLADARLSAETLTIMLLRKLDWHDVAGVRLVLARGADPGRTGRWGRAPLEHAMVRDNALAILEALLDAGADPMDAGAGVSLRARAARLGRGDVLEACTRRGIARPPLEETDALLAACATNDGEGVAACVARAPGARTALRAHGGATLVAFARVGNAAGVAHLLALGVPVDACDPLGDGYWGIAPASTALHVAAWRAWPQTVSVLVTQGADVHARDGAGRTPLALAVRACTEAYWADRRSPRSVAELLEAGARVDGIPGPSGYPPVDDLLRRHGAPW